MKYLKYTKEEHLYLLKVIYEEDHFDIEVLGHMAYKKFNEVRSIRSYMVKISDIRDYFLSDETTKFKKNLRNDIKEFMIINSKKDKDFNEIFMYKIKSLKNFKGFSHSGGYLSGF